MTQRLLPERLLLARTERGLTLRQAAKVTGVAKETLSDLERGHRNPHPSTLYKIAQGYGLPVRDFLDTTPASPIEKMAAGTSGREDKALSVKWALHASESDFLSAINRATKVEDLRELYAGLVKSRHPRGLYLCGAIAQQLYSRGAVPPAVFLGGEKQAWQLRTTYE